MRTAISLDGCISGTKDLEQAVGNDLLRAGHDLCALRVTDMVSCRLVGSTMLPSSMAEPLNFNRHEAPAHDSTPRFQGVRGRASSDLEGSEPLYRLSASVVDMGRASAQQGDGWFRRRCSQCVGNRLQA